MIKFFRKIRQNLLSEGKTTKYLKYAIGEIILVVIGILIALQLNSWGESKKNDTIRHQYYLQLIDELKENKIYIEEIIQKYSQNISTYNKVIYSLNSQSLTTDQIFNKYSLVNYEYQNIIFHTGTIESLISTGEIKLTPQSIRNKLLDLKHNMDRRTIVNGELNQEYKDRIRLASLSSGGVIGEMIENKTLLNKTISAHVKNSLEDIILSKGAGLWVKNHNEKITVEACSDLIKKIKIIEKLINSELKN
ncbi:DUF6090 family protein [Flavobacteriaceae bacterium GSB9]|nr:DUF6090 family protein [Flavobacteriaceae bacterium GSB9]